MVTTMLVWVLITVSDRSVDIAYSPPFATLAECQRVQEVIGNRDFSSKCVQMTIVMK